MRNDKMAVKRRVRCDAEQLAAGHVLIAAEVLSTWSGRRDRVHKMSDHADAGIPHYWLVSFDKVGAATIERCALAGGSGRYVHAGTSHRDMGPMAVNISAPFPVQILWADLEVAPRVLPNPGRPSGDTCRHAETRTRGSAGSCRGGYTLSRRHVRRQGG